MNWWKFGQFTVTLGKLHYMFHNHFGIKETILLFRSPFTQLFSFVLVILSSKRPWCMFQLSHRSPSSQLTCQIFNSMDTFSISHRQCGISSRFSAYGLPTVWITRRTSSVGIYRYIPCSLNPADTLSDLMGYFQHHWQDNWTFTVKPWSVFGCLVGTNPGWTITPGVRKYEASSIGSVHWCCDLM